MGLDEIWPEYLKSLDVVLADTRRLQHRAQLETASLEWQTGVVVPLKGDWRGCSDYQESQSFGNKQWELKKEGLLSTGINEDMVSSYGYEGKKGL